MISKQDILKVIKELIEFPDSKICKHHVAATLLSLLEAKGYKLDNDLVKAIVDADDETSLSILKGK